MRKILLLLAMAAGVMSLSAATPRNEVNIRKQQRAESPMAKAVAKAKKIEALNTNSNGVWLPGIKTYFWWDSENSAWESDGGVVFTYYTDGKVKEEINGDSKEVYTYNANGNVETISSYNQYDGVETLSGVTTYKYDTKVQDYVVLVKCVSEYSTWGNGSEIVRNAAGNVTNVKGFSIGENDERFYYGDELVIKYGADGKANEMYYQETYEGETEIFDHLINVTWENTDGQILDLEIDDYDADLYFGANRIKSATYIDEELPYPATLAVTYTGADYKAEMKMNTETIFSYDYKALDSYGSFICVEYEVDYDEEDGEYYIDYSKDVTRHCEFDKFGTEILDDRSYVYHYDEGDETGVEISKNIATYDATYGYPLEYVRVEKDDETSDFTNRSKVVYGDYTFFDGVNSVIIDSAEAPVEYYNLQGARVENPSTGLYIMRKGTKTAKVYVK